jgi:hypothetical protein
MVRKKRRGKQPTKSAGRAAKAGAASTHSEPEMSVHAVTQDEALVSEVQTFVAKRGELAKKLSDEIKSTEKKLAELKKTAAMLSTEPSSAAPKEPKPRPTKRKARRKKAAKKAPKPELAPIPETPEQPASAE